MLVSSAGAKIPMLSSVAKSLRGIPWTTKLVAGDSNANSLAFNFADAKWIMPETVYENLGAIIQGCIERDIGFIIPTRDGELTFWAQYRDIFTARGVVPIVSNLPSVEACLDKKYFAETLRRIGIPVIQTSLDPTEIEASRLVVKERFGSGSKNIAIDVDLPSAKKIKKQISHAIFQPYVEGSEFSVDCWRSIDGVSTITSPRWRSKVINGESQVTRTFKSEDISAVSEAILEALNLTGIAVIQGFQRQDGSLEIIECNARFGGATTASIAAGAPLIELALLDHAKKEYSNMLTSVKVADITQVRVSKDYIFHDFDL